MEVQQIANIVMELLKQDGYRDDITPSYYTKLNHCNVHNEYLLEVKGQYDFVYLFKKTKLFSLGNVHDIELVVAEVKDNHLIITLNDEVIYNKEIKTEVLEYAR